MDANGTRFHLLLGTRDWIDRTDISTSSEVEWNERSQEVTLRRLPFQFKASRNDRAPSLADRRGAARDRYGNWYWIDATATEVSVRSVGTGVTSRFWRTGDGACAARESARGSFAPVTPPASLPPLALAGLAVTDDHYLVVGVVDPAGLLIFDLHAGGAPQQICWPQGIDFAPFDLARRRGGGVWILDRAFSRIWQIDRRFAIVRRLPPSSVEPPLGRFRDATGDTHVDAIGDPLAAILSGDAWPAPASAIAIEAVPDPVAQGDVLFVMDRPPTGPSTIYYYAAIDRSAQAIVLGAPSPAGHDLAYAPPDPRAVTGRFGRLFVVDRLGNQAFGFDADLTDAGVLQLAPLPQYFPMQVFGGKALVTAGGQPYYDFDQTWIPLVEQKRPRYGATGELLVAALDGREPDCVWHRLLLDACVPPETTVEIWSRAANTRADLAVATWNAEPRIYRRATGSEQPFAPTRQGLGAGTWETLFQAAKGRYLELRLRLGGNGRSTPRLQAMRVYYPRFSYLSHYLPAVYREDAASAGFVDRYLANTEGTLTAIEDRIAAVQALFDVRSAPPEALDWLASWFDLALDPLWDVSKRRLLIAHGMDFFARRGTAQGLQTAVALTLFDCAMPGLFGDTNAEDWPGASIRIIEKFRTRQVAPIDLGDPDNAVGPRIGLRQTSWTPSQGRDALLKRYSAALAAAGIDASGTVSFPIVAPSDAASATVWTTFVRDALGFVPGIATVPAATWHEFLARRYHGVSSFNEVYGRSGSAAVRQFDDVSVPAIAPPDGAPLVDWYEFETVALATAAVAHQFSVLLPMRPSAAADSAEHQVRLDLARRIVALEKPAHTTFDIRFYWSMFRVGEARLGRDTVIDRGSRAPDLMTPSVLGNTHLGESYLAPSHPQNVKDRRLVIGRGPLPC